MAIHGSLAAGKFGSPDLIEQLLSRQDLLWATGQNQQERRFGSGQGKGLALVADPGHLEVDVESAKIAARVLTTSQQGPHPGHQLAWMERLGQEIVGSRLQAFYALKVLAARADHENTQARVVLTGLTANFETVESGQHPVQDHQIVGPAAQPVEGLQAVAGAITSVALALQVGLHHVDQVFLIFYQENQTAHFLHIGQSNFQSVGLGLDCREPIPGKPNQGAKTMRKIWIVGLTLCLSGTLWSEPRPQSPIFEPQARQSGLARAAFKVQQRHPGVLAGIVRHWMTDLEGEPLQAWLDVHQAVLQRYPDLPARFALWMAEERRLHAPPRERVAGLRTWLLERKPERPEVREVLFRHRKTLRQSLLSLSRWVDRDYPELPAQIRQRAEGQTMFQVLAQEAPGFGAKAVVVLRTQHGPELRALAVDLLEAWEKSAQQRPAPNWAAFTQAFPDLPRQSSEFHLARLERWRLRIQQNYPELPSIVRQTMEEKHPELRARALESVEKHYPGLVMEWKQAVQQELPGWGPR